MTTENVKVEVEESKDEVEDEVEVEMDTLELLNHIHCHKNEILLNMTTDDVADLILKFDEEFSDTPDTDPIKLRASAILYELGVEKPGREAGVVVDEPDTGIEMKELGNVLVTINEVELDNELELEEL